MYIIKILLNLQVCFNSFLAAIYALQLPDVEDGVYIHGIFTNCFRFDIESMKMVSEKNRVMNEQMPILHMKPQLDFSPPLEDYICPLYKTSARAGILSTTGWSKCFY